MPARPAPKRNAPTSLLATLEQRFAEHTARHRGLRWVDVAARIESNASALKVLQAMEDSGGEPDVTGVDKKTGRVTFTDCSPESPAGRRSLCYDRAALDARKEAKPKSSALEVAAKLGIRVLDEAEYRALQQLGEFDLKTSSWILTPAPIRALGGALFCDRRYDQVFTYHNGAQSYYAARGVRGAVDV